MILLKGTPGLIGIKFMGCAVRKLGWSTWNGIDFCLELGGCTGWIIAG